MNYKNILTLPTIIKHIGRILNIANKIIPAYKQATPIIKNIKKTASIISELKSDSKKNTITKELVKQSSNKNRPQFFQ